MGFTLEELYQSICHFRDNGGYPDLEELLEDEDKIFSKLDEGVTQLVEAFLDKKPNRITKKVAKVLYYQMVALAVCQVDFSLVCHRLSEKRSLGLTANSVEGAFNKIAHFINNGGHEHISKIYRKGEDKIREKLTEEVTEFIIACKKRKSLSIIDEASDLLYYLLITLAYSELSLDEVGDRIQQKRNLLAVSS